MDSFQLMVIGNVRGGRDVPEDDNWEGVSAVIELYPNLFTAEALLGLDQFSHAEIVFVFNQVSPDDITYDARRPRRTGRRSASSRSAGAIGQTGLACRSAGSPEFPA